MSDGPDQLDVALEVGAALTASGCAWMIGGSIATSAYGEPRSTHDVDLVTDLASSQVEAFLAALGKNYYADIEAIREATRRRSLFNVIHLETTDKIDLFCAGDPFARHGLENARRVPLADGREAPVAAPEDMVVEKLRWYRPGGEVSKRQLRDVAGVLQVMGARLDLDRMRHWAQELGVEDLLERLLAEADLG